MPASAPQPARAQHPAASGAGEDGLANRLSGPSCGAGRSGRCWRLREGAHPAANSPAPRHLASAPRRGKPRGQPSSLRKDVVLQRAARDTSSSWRNTLFPALLAAWTLERGQPWRRALPNVFKPPRLPSQTLLKPFEGWQRGDGTCSWQALDGLCLPARQRHGSCPNSPRHQASGGFFLPVLLFPTKRPRLSSCPVPGRGGSTLTAPSLLKGAFMSCPLILFLEQDCVLKIRGGC